MIWPEPSPAVSSRTGPERGWHREGERYRRTYQTGYGSWVGHIKQRSANEYEVYILHRQRRSGSTSTGRVQEAFKKLTTDRDEFDSVTGVDLPGNHVMTQMLDLRHLSRTLLGVTADPRDTHQLLIRLEVAGHRLLGHFHSHPGKGIGSTLPSGIDERFQNDLERGGHMALMAIFSRDGFIRFIRMKDQFALTVFGEGIER